MVKDFKISGLNGGGKKAYATIRMDNEDWFHANFDDERFPPDRQVALFNYFKNGDDNVWKDNKDLVAVVQFDGYSTGGMPINPIIVDIKNLQ